MRYAKPDKTKEKLKKSRRITRASILLTQFGGTLFLCPCAERVLYTWNLNRRAVIHEKWPNQFVEATERLLQQAARASHYYIAVSLSKLLRARLIVDTAYISRVVCVCICNVWLTACISRAPARAAGS